MRSPLDAKPVSAPHLIRYLPHENCAKVYEFLGLDNYCDGDDDLPSDLPFDVTNDLTCNPGDYICKHPDGRLEVVPFDDVLDRIGTPHTRLET
jgi:hypothetical protein